MDSPLVWSIVVVIFFTLNVLFVLWLIGVVGVSPETRALRKPIGWVDAIMGPICTVFLVLFILWYIAEIFNPPKFCVWWNYTDAAYKECQEFNDKRHLLWFFD